MFFLALYKLSRRDFLILEDIALFVLDINDNYKSLSTKRK